MQAPIKLKYGIKIKFSIMLKITLKTTLKVRTPCLLIDVNKVPVILLTSLIGINNASIWKAKIDCEN